MHGQTIRSRPLLAQAARARALRDGGRMVCIGGPDFGEGSARLHDHSAVHRDLERWLRSVEVDLVIGWGVEAVEVVARQSTPVAVVLDGMLDPDRRPAAVTWMRDRRLSVLVTAATLARRLEEATSGRARLTVLPPLLVGVSAAQEAVSGNLVRIVAPRPEVHTIRHCFDLIVRLLLAGRPLQVEADPGFLQCKDLSPLMEQLGAGVITTPEDAWPGLVAAPPLRGDRRGEEAVLPLLAAWLQGATVLLPRGHAAAELLSSVDGGVPDCDGNLATATEVLDGLGPGPDRAAQVEAWGQASDACFESLVAEAHCT